MGLRTSAPLLVIGLGVALANATYAAGGKFVAVEFSETQTPRIDKARRPVKIILPTAIEVAIARKLPGYRLPRDEDYKFDWLEFYKENPIPFLALGDFNRDGRKDVAALLRSQKDDQRWRLVVFHGQPEGFAATVLVSSPEADKASPQYGQSYGPIQRHGITAKSKCGDGRPCLELFVFESASHEYVWDGRGYKQITLSD